MKYVSILYSVIQLHADYNMISHIPKNSTTLKHKADLGDRHYVHLIYNICKTLRTFTHVMKTQHFHKR